MQISGLVAFVATFSSRLRILFHLQRHWHIIFNLYTHMATEMEKNGRKSQQRTQWQGLKISRHQMRFKCAPLACSLGCLLLFFSLEMLCIRKYKKVIRVDYRCGSDSRLVFRATNEFEVELRSAQFRVTPAADKKKSRADDS